MDTVLVYRIILIFAIIGVNAFFAGAEIALVSVRSSRLRQLAGEGAVGAQAASPTPTPSREIRTIP